MSKRWTDFILDAVAYILVIGFIVLLVHFLCGCSPKYITVPEYHYEKHHTNDTIIERDSILKEKNTIIREADSTMLAALGIRIKEGERAILVLQRELERAMSQQREAVHDTIIKVDSIRVPYPVEKDFSTWQKLQIKASLIILYLAIVVGLVWLFIFQMKKHAIKK